jgi:uncharacterized metal-binding protein
MLRRKYSSNELIFWAKVWLLLAFAIGFGTFLLYFLTDIHNTFYPAANGGMSIGLLDSLTSSALMALLFAIIGVLWLVRAFEKRDKEERWPTSKQMMASD